jgi:hypothetical protein
VDQDVNDINPMAQSALPGTKRRLKSKAKLIAKKECDLKLIQELQHLYFNEKLPIWQLSGRFKLKWGFIYRTLKKYG